VVNIKKKIVTKVLVTSLLLLSSLSSASARLSSQDNSSSDEDYSNNDLKEKWVVIICGGERPKKDIKDGAKNFRKTSVHVYETYKKLGYDDEHIFFIHDKNVSAEGADCIVSKSRVRYAITEWLDNHSDYNDDCCIVFNGHGGPGLLSLWDIEKNISEFVYFFDFSKWIDQIDYNVLTIIIDSCYSGTFIRPLSKENRIIISSTAPFRKGIALNEIVFSYHFFNKLAENVSYGKAWEYADKQLACMNIPKDLWPDLGKTFYETLKLWVKCKKVMFLQNPKIDDNWDRQGHGNHFANKLPIIGDGKLALNTYPGKVSFDKNKIGDV